MALSPGDKAPAIKLSDQSGSTVDLSDRVKGSSKGTPANLIKSLAT